MKDRTTIAPIARYIRRARQEAGMSQESLGEKLGVTKGNVSAWENDRHSPSPQQLAAISRSTGVHLPEELSPSVGKHLDEQAANTNVNKDEICEKVGTYQQETPITASAIFSEQAQNLTIQQAAKVLETVCKALGFTLEEVYTAMIGKSAQEPKRASIRVTSESSARSAVDRLLHKKSPRKAGNQEGS